MRSPLTRYHLLLVVTAGGVVMIVYLTHGWAQWGWLLALTLLSGLYIGFGVTYPEWQFFGESFCRAKTQKKWVALTFDDGPDPENTPALLALLAKRGVCATFFVIGQRVARHPELASRMAKAGHAVENHTYWHNLATNLFPVLRLIKELIQTQTEIRRATGRAPAFFRTPAGLTNPRVFQVTTELGLHMAGHTAYGRDHRPDAPEVIAGRLLAKLQPGAIFLLHDAGVPQARLLAVVTLVLDRLEADGYRCVRLDELKQEHDANSKPNANERFR